MIDSKVVTQNANISISVLMQYCRKNAVAFFAFLGFFAFCFKTVIPRMIQTCSAPQNDRLNFNFVKVFHTVGTKLAINGRKMVIYQSIF